MTLNNRTDRPEQTDPDQMPQNMAAASDQGLHCLHIIKHYFRHINKYTFSRATGNFLDKRVFYPYEKCDGDADDNVDVQHDPYESAILYRRYNNRLSINLYYLSQSFCIGTHVC